MTETELRALLEAHRIPINTWGTGGSKTFEHLFKEMSEGESTLLAQHGHLVREGHGVIVDVFYNSSPRLILWEEKQVYVDGRIRVREGLLASVGEKMRPSELPHEAAHRALAEELGIATLLPIQPVGTLVKGPVPSGSFPGLLTVHRMHKFEVVFPESLYKPEGYVEVQKDKTSYFIWKQIT